MYISHRLASTRFCDRIILLADGRIAECGTHDELLAAGGEYARLFEVQSRYYKENPDATDEGWAAAIDPQNEEGAVGAREKEDAPHA